METKYRIKQVVYFFMGDDVSSSSIKKIIISGKHNIEYELEKSPQLFGKKSTYTEDDIFPTAKELVNNKIEKLKELLKKCEK